MDKSCDSQASILPSSDITFPKYFKKNEETLQELLYFNVEEELKWLKSIIYGICSIRE